MAETEDLDMGLHRIINVGTGVAVKDAVTMQQFLDNQNSVKLQLDSLLLYYIYGTSESAPAASAVILRSSAPCNFLIPQGRGGHVASCGTVATSDTLFSLEKNGTEIGTMTFPAGEVFSTFSITADTNFLPGDMITVVAPGTPDATLKEIAITLTGIRF